SMPMTRWYFKTGSFQTSLGPILVECQATDRQDRKISGDSSEAFAVTRFTRFIIMTTFTVNKNRTNLDAYSQPHPSNHQRRHSRFRGTEATHRHADCRTPGHATRWPYRGSRYAGSSKRQTTKI